jgi:hypothetical protein
MTRSIALALFVVFVSFYYFQSRAAISGMGVGTTTFRTRVGGGQQLSIDAPAELTQMVFTTNYLISLVLVSGSPALGSIWEDPEGEGSCLGVTPSISRWPSGHTMCRSNTILTPKPPLDSSAAR